MTKLITTSLYFHPNHLFFAPSFPLLKTFPIFVVTHFLNWKRPKWQKFEIQAPTAK